MSILLELTRGQARVRQVVFHRGQPRPTVSIGRAAAWSIVADDLEDVHAFVSFDGAALMVRSADDSNPAWLDGRAIPCAWTPARGSQILALGGARIAIVAVQDEASTEAPDSEPVTGQFDIATPVHSPQATPGRASRGSGPPPPRPPPPRGALPPPVRPPLRAPSAPPPRSNVQMPDDDESTRMLDAPAFPHGAGHAAMPSPLGSERHPHQDASDAPDFEDATRTLDVGHMRANEAPPHRPMRPDLGPPPSADEATMMLDAARGHVTPGAGLMPQASPSAALLSSLAATRPMPPPSEIGGNPSSETQMKPMTAPVIRPPSSLDSGPSWGDATQLGDISRPVIDPLAATGQGPSLPRFTPPPGLGMPMPSLGSQPAFGAPTNSGQPAPAAGDSRSEITAGGGKGDAKVAKKPAPKWVGPAGAGLIIAGYLVYLYIHVQNTKARTVVDKAVIPTAQPTATLPVTNAASLQPSLDQPTTLPNVANPVQTAAPLDLPNKHLTIVDAGVSDASTTVERAAVDAIARNDKARAIYFYSQLSAAAPNNRAYSEPVRILTADLADGGI